MIDPFIVISTRHKLVDDRCLSGCGIPPTSISITFVQNIQLKRVACSSEATSEKTIRQLGLYPVQFVANAFRGLWRRRRFLLVVMTVADRLDTIYHGER